MATKRSAPARKSGARPNKTAAKSAAVSKRATKKPNAKRGNSVRANFHPSTPKSGGPQGAPMAPIHGEGPHAFIVGQLVNKIEVKQDKDGGIVLDIHV